MPLDRGDLQRRLHEVAFRQAGYFTAAQALAAGYSYQAQKHHRDRGNWQTIDRALFRLPGWPPGPEDTWARWCVWAGPRSAVSHESALVVHDLTVANPARVTLTLPEPTKRADDAVRLHIAPLPDDDVLDKGSFRVTTVRRTIEDLAAGRNSQEVVDEAVADALERGLVTAAELRRRIGGPDDRLSWRLQQALEAAS